MLYLFLWIEKKKMAGQLTLSRAYPQSQKQLEGDHKPHQLDLDEGVPESLNEGKFAESPKVCDNLGFRPTQLMALGTKEEL
nr:hypothetical protein [uncultured Limnohabitans sp.]